MTVPGAAATGRDLFRTVTIRPDGSPFRWVFRYMEAIAPDGERSLICVETSIEQPVDDPAELEGQDVPPLTAPALSDWKRLESIARTNLSALLGGSREGELPPAAGSAARPLTSTTEIPRRKALTREFLEEIASRYRRHLAAGLPPTQTIMREERVSRRTVGNWLAAARREGLLGEAPRGVAGEENR
ncbi:hypothetical protein [Miltoncostaea marina]|uniref:hypothetical protein n=1 Tax=Miltoncostaea marina TaxID=2843215 RepID=UPI001C3C285F|nr:hypothetical protein [Miltoncostaea marina]